MDTTVKQLVERFNDGIATPEERLALLRMLQRGEHVEYFGDELEARILYFLERPHLLDITEQEDAIATALEKASRKKVYNYSKPTRSLTTYWPWAAAAAVLILIVSTLYYNRHTTTTDTIASTTGDTAAATDSKPTTQLQARITGTHTYKGRQWLHLPDGTTVLLNDNSHLQYDSTFGIDTRTVTLTGEAYFDVKHDEKHPFHVRSGKIDTQVLGTAFNINAFPGQKNVTVTVRRGRVRVSNTKKELAVLTPRQQLSVNAINTRQATTTTIDPDKAIAWTKDFIIFEDMNIAEVAATLSTKYGVSVNYNWTGPIEDCRLNAAFIHGENLEQILTVISKVFHGTYTKKDDGNILITASCE